MRTPATGRPDGSPRYEIRLEGHLDARWAAWFDGLAFRTQPDGTTVLRGPVVDQAALHGVLPKVRDIGLPLISVTRLDGAQAHTPATHPADPWRKAT